MKTLAFSRLADAEIGGGKRLREARFEQRSSLPASAACVVANGVRETLTSLLGAAALVRLFEPLLPDARGWEAIVRSAMLYRVRGSVADAAIVFREEDASAIASAVFNEPPSPALSKRALSPIECEVLDRVANAIAANLAAVCGAREVCQAERVSAIDGFVTFLELQVERPVEARIGIALSRDPAPEPRGALDFTHIADVRITAVASLDLGSVRAAAVAALMPGAVLPINADDLRRCSLTASGLRLARGRCGVRNGRFAIAAPSIRETT
jgi:hypothetical protein